MKLRFSSESELALPKSLPNKKEHMRMKTKQNTVAQSALRSAVV
jgi:hypothetical protein